MFIPSCEGLIGKKFKDKVITNDKDFAMILLKEKLVSVVHGEAFGLSPFFRISYATSMDNIKFACNRIGELCNEATSLMESKKLLLKKYHGKILIPVTLMIIKRLNPFKIKTDYSPSGDQPQAIKSLVKGIKKTTKDHKSFWCDWFWKNIHYGANYRKSQKPALILAPNKTLAAQLYGEFKDFFPDNAVEYFVSYYDYYQPEAYVPRTDTYIEKDASINEQIDRLRHSATRSLLERGDVIIVASVSCIYGIGSVETYSNMIINMSKRAKN